MIFVSVQQLQLLQNVYRMPVPKGRHTPAVSRSFVSFNAVGAHTKCAVQTEEIVKHMPNVIKLLFFYIIALC